jgi:hypothetical protein
MGFGDSPWTDKTQKGRRKNYLQQPVPHFAADVLMFHDLYPYALHVPNYTLRAIPEYALD